MHVIQFFLFISFTTNLKNCQRQLKITNVELVALTSQRLPNCKKSFNTHGSQ